MAVPSGANPAPFPLKGDREAIEQRRHMVGEMMLRGMPLVTIAKMLNVHRNTILNDAKELKRASRASITHMDPISEIAETVEKLKMLGAEAVVQYHQADRPQAKNAFLNTARAIETDKMKILMLTGLVPSEVAKNVIEAELVADKSKKVESKFERKGVKDILSNPESRRKILSAMSKLVQVGGKDVLKQEADKKEIQNVQKITGGAAGGEGSAQAGAGGNSISAQPDKGADPKAPGNRPATDGGGDQNLRPPGGNS